MFHAMDETQYLYLFLMIVAVLMFIISTFYHPDKEKHPHRVAARALRRRPRSKYGTDEEKTAVMSSLDHHLDTHMSRCPYCGTGSPGWDQRELMDLTDIKRKVVFSVTVQTCRKCGHVQLFGADWLRSER
jgi:hypothetical protein